MKKAVIFDLDGTLLNTLDDILDGVNHSLGKYSLNLINLKECMTYIGDGPLELIKKSCKDNIDFIELVYNEYLDFYNKNSNNKTKPYNGIISLLNKLKALGLKLCVVSNKQDEAVREMVSFYFNDLIDISIGSSINYNKKPSFDMIDVILNKLDISRSDALYVGDSEVDVLTVKDKMDNVMVSWGFRDKDVLIKNGASNIVDTPIDILKFI